MDVTEALSIDFFCGRVCCFLIKTTMKKSTYLKFYSKILKKEIRIDYLQRGIKI